MILLTAHEEEPIQVLLPFGLRSSSPGALPPTTTAKVMDGGTNKNNKNNLVIGQK